MQFRCRIPAGWRFFVPLCNTQHGAYESDSSLHRRLFTDGNFEKNRRGGCAGSGPARRELQCNGKYGGRSGRWYKCRRRQRGKGVHDNRPDACGGKTAVLPADAAAVFAVPVYGGRVAPAALERLQEIRGEGTPAVVLAVYGNRAFGTAVAQLAAFVAERGFVPVAAGAFVGEHSYSTPARRSPKDVPIRRTSPKRPLSERASAKSLRTERPARSTPQNSASRIRRCCQNCGSSVSCWGTAGGRNAIRGRTAPRGRRRTVHPMRPLCRTLSHAGDRARATNCTPTRRAASAAVHASKAARSAHARSKRLSLPFCRATSPGGNRRNAYVI